MIIGLALVVGVAAVQAATIGWETWSEVSPDTWSPSLTQSGLTGVAEGTHEAGGSWFNHNNATVAYGASADGTFGTLASPAADTTVALGEGVSLANGYDGWIDFTVVNSSGAALLLTGFHFDSGAFRANAAHDWDLSVLAGSDITVGSLGNGVTTVAAAPITDDWDVDLTGLPDSRLEAGESATFRLRWTGGTAPPSAGGHNVMVDNVAITAIDGTVHMTTLGSPQYWTTASIWDNNQAPDSKFDYVVPATGNLRSPDGNTTFPGASLTVQAGGKIQFRAKEELGTVTTVNGLVATGGTVGNFVNLAAGTGNNTTNHLDGALQNDGFTRLSGYGNATGPRNIRISSLIGGDGTLHSTGTASYPHTCTIDNANNTFSGVWESKVGTLIFEDAGAVGTADIEVLSGGALTILGDWDMFSALTVADSASATVNLGNYDWTVGSLVVGSSAVGYGTYLVADLNALGDAVFSGSGSITVEAPPAQGAVFRIK